LRAVFSTLRNGCCAPGGTRELPSAPRGIPGGAARGNASRPHGCRATGAPARQRGRDYRASQVTNARIVIALAMSGRSNGTARRPRGGGRRQPSGENRERRPGSVRSCRLTRPMASLGPGAMSATSASRGLPVRRRNRGENDSRIERGDAATEEERRNCYDHGLPPAEGHNENRLAGVPGGVRGARGGSTGRLRTW
jgi:hypothetical protein